MKTYKGLITTLEPHQVFVFGSNTQGRHGKGAARIAFDHFGAKWGHPKGLLGQSYAIVTKDLTATKHPSIPASHIIHQIERLYDIADSDTTHEYLIAYSGTGVNLNGYTPRQMAGMFGCMQIPDNIVFEEAFSKLLNC